MNRRHFVRRLAGSTLCVGAAPFAGLLAGKLAEPLAGEDLVGYVERTAGAWDPWLYARLVGAANEFKEGDESLGLAAESAEQRRVARELLLHTKLRVVDERPILDDALLRTLRGSLDERARAATAD